MSLIHRLKIIYKSKEEEWKFVHDLSISLRQNRLLEQDVVRQIKLDEDIKTVEEKLSEISQELSELEVQISQVNKSLGIDEAMQVSDDIWNSSSDDSQEQEILNEDIEAIYETLPEEVKAMVEDLRQRLERAKGKTFTFLLIGKAGMGKSSTINSLMGAQVSPIGDFDPCTTDVTFHETNLHEAIIRVIDTPGLCDEEEEVGNDAKYIEMMRQKIPYAIDAVLFVSRLDENRVDASEKRGLRLITEAFGELFWKKAVIVFTHSDKVSDERFEEFLRERTKRIHAHLSTLRLSNDTVHLIPSVAASNNVEKVNPDGQEWIQQLYLTVLNRIESEDIKDIFLLSTTHMAEKLGISPLKVMSKTAGIVGAAATGAQTGAALAAAIGVGSTSVGAISGPTGAVLTGLFLINNPIGWAIVLGAAVGGGYYGYRALKDL
jgi:GTP1/Obg family GTP-binding protein